MRIRVAGYSHSGNQRDTNQDHFCVDRRVAQGEVLSYSIASSTEYYKNHGLLAVVADGMGGHEGGQLASRVALEQLAQEYYAKALPDEDGPSLCKRVARCLARACKQLRKTLKEKELRQAGTTLAGVALKGPDSLVVFHIGDSRVLKSDGQEVRPLTVDHTPVGADLASGKLTDEQAMAAKGSNQLTRSFGLIGNNRAEVQLLSFSAGDRLLLATDGFHAPGRGLDDASILTTLGGDSWLYLKVPSLVEQAVQRDGHDNTTLVALEVEKFDLSWVGKIPQ